VEVPAGVLADSFSRRWSLVLSHLLMGAAMLVTGLVVSFPALVATQMLWGVSWCFASGADVAWVTDELDQRRVAGPVLARAARAEMVGSALGLVGLGALAWATSLTAAIVVAGTAMTLLGGYVAWGFRELHFVGARTQRWTSSRTILRQGFRLTGRSPDIRLMFAATILVNGAAASGRLHPKRLLDLGLPTTPDPILWLTGLGILTLLVAALALKIVERRVAGAQARLDYAVVCIIGVLGALLLASAPEPFTGGLAVLLVSGISIPLTRLIGVIWVNARTVSEVRATTLSLLAQAEYLGVITCGALIALLAALTDLETALSGCAALFALTALLLLRRPWFARSTDFPRPHR
jgi:MFS family permease